MNIPSFSYGFSSSSSIIFIYIWVVTLYFLVFLTGNSSFIPAPVDYLSFYNDYSCLFPSHSSKISIIFSTNLYLSKYFWWWDRHCSFVRPFPKKIAILAKYPVGLRPYKESCSSILALKKSKYILFSSYDHFKYFFLFSKGGPRILAVNSGSFSVSVFLLPSAFFPFEFIFYLNRLLTKPKIIPN